MGLHSVELIEDASGLPEGFRKIALRIGRLLLLGTHGLGHSHGIRNRKLARERERERDLLNALLLCDLLGGGALNVDLVLLCGILVLLVLACEGVCWLFDILRVFPLFFTGFMALCVLTGDLIGTVICKLWTNIHH